MALMSLFEGNFGSGVPKQEYAAGMSLSEAAGFIHTLLKTTPETQPLAEAFTQADIELALDDRGWLVGGKRMAGELDPLSRQVQVNRSRYYWLRDPLVKQAVRLWTDYSLGATAMAWNAIDPETKESDDTTQKKLNDFMYSRKNRQRYTSKGGQRRLSQRLLVDGELFFGFFEDNVMRTFDCLQMTDILTDPDDEDQVVAYKRVCNKVTGGTASGGSATVTRYYRPWDYDGDAPKWAYGEMQPYYGGDPAKMENIKYEEDVVMYHLPFDPLERRGNSLISASSDWSREHRRFMTARVAIVQALAKFAFKGTVKGGQQAINAIMGKLQSTFAQTGLDGGTEHQPATAPGGTWLQNEGVSLESMPQKSGAGDAKGDGDQLKLMHCAGTGIMLHYFGDPSTGNLATATAMELPMLKMFGAYQEFWKDAWKDMFSIVLGEKEEDEEKKQISISYPDIIEEDLQKLGAFLTSFTGIFPEAKVPRVMKRCLESMDISDIDDVMSDIEDNKAELDEKNQQNAKLQQSNKLEQIKAMKPALAAGGGAEQGAGGSAGEGDATEALVQRMDAVLEAIGIEVKE